VVVLKARAGERPEGMAVAEELATEGQNDSRRKKDSLWYYNEHGHDVYDPVFLLRKLIG